MSMIEASIAQPTPEPHKALGAQRWYAAQVQPRRERLALAHLARQDFATYCPVVKRTRRLGGRSVTGEEAMFPGYVFVAFDIQRERWRSVNGTIGVMRLISFGTQPAPLPQGFVERLQDLAGTGGLVRYAETFQPGDSVRIVGGAFNGLCGALASGGARERVTVLLQLLSGETKVTLPRASLVAA